MEHESPLVIRPLEQGDRDFFDEVDYLTTIQSLSEDDRARYEKADLEIPKERLLARDGNEVFIAVSNGERAGVIWLGEKENSLSGELEAWIYNITVTPQFRGKGIGKLLIAHAERWARARGQSTIGLMVADHNQTARKLYAACSFSTTNIVMRKRIQ